MVESIDVARNLYLERVLRLLNRRERKILDLLIEDPHIGMAQMSSHLDVSMVTVRSDYDALAEKGYLIRARGGACGFPFRGS